MSKVTTDATRDRLTMEQWLEIRKEAALRIDPETAKVMWSYEQTLDPYAVYRDLAEELQQIGREFFARSPGSDIWVRFGDLPVETAIDFAKCTDQSCAFPPARS